MRPPPGTLYLAGGFKFILDGWTEDGHRIHHHAGRSGPKLTSASTGWPKEFVILKLGLTDDPEGK